VYDETATGRIGPALAEQGARLVRAVDSRFAGVDVVTLDPGAAVRPGSGALLEVNTTPGIHHHYQGDQDRREHPVAVRVLRHLLGA
jgi:cyanophycin synthetase